MSRGRHRRTLWSRWKRRRKMPEVFPIIGLLFAFLFGICAVGFILNPSSPPSAESPQTPRKSTTAPQGTETPEPPRKSETPGPSHVSPVVSDTPHPPMVVESPKPSASPSAKTSIKQTDKPKPTKTSSKPTHSQEGSSPPVSVTPETPDPPVTECPGIEIPIDGICVSPDLPVLH